MRVLTLGAACPLALYGVIKAISGTATAIWLAGDAASDLSDPYFHWAGRYTPPIPPTPGPSAPAAWLHTPFDSADTSGDAVRDLFVAANTTPADEVWVTTDQRINHRDEAGTWSLDLNLSAGSRTVQGLQGYDFDNIYAPADPITPNAQIPYYHWDGSSWGGSALDWASGATTPTRLRRNQAGAASYRIDAALTKDVTNSSNSAWVALDYSSETFYGRYINAVGDPYGVYWALSLNEVYGATIPVNTLLPPILVYTTGWDTVSDPPYEFPILATFVNQPAWPNDRVRVTGISGMAADDWWVCARQNGGAFPYTVQHYDGSGWTGYTLPASPLMTRIRPACIRAFATDDVYIGGSVICTPPGEFSGPTLAVLWHWDGAAWTLIPIPRTGTE